MSDFIDYDPAEKPRPVMQTRNEIIEECARVVDNAGPDPMAVWIAAAIRALKDKPTAP